jgi:hypothetical protein
MGTSASPCPEAAITYPNGDRYFGPYHHGKRKGVGWALQHSSAPLH